VETDSNGAYAFTGVTIAAGNVLTLYLEDETADAVTVTLIAPDALSILLFTTSSGDNYVAERVTTAGGVTTIEADGHRFHYRSRACVNVHVPSREKPAAS
jgi:hypothetical protein